MNTHNHSNTLLKRTVDILITVAFLSCAFVWLVDQPFFSIERFKLAELHYRQKVVFDLRRNVIFLEQLGNSMQESPEIFLSALERLFPNRMEAQSQFEKDFRRNRLETMREKENLNFARSDLDWIDPIERQVIDPRAEIPMTSVTSMDRR
jgi:hypothetical protein